MIAAPFTQQTKGLGVDFEFDGTSSQVIVQYMQCMGRDNLIQEMVGILRWSDKLVASRTCLLFE